MLKFHQIWKCRGEKEVFVKHHSICIKNISSSVMKMTSQKFSFQEARRKQYFDKLYMLIVKGSQDRLYSLQDVF